MVRAVRSGRSMRSVAEKFGVSLRTVQRWVERAEGRRLDRVDWTDRPRGPRPPVNRTPQAMEERILAVRRELKQTSALGDYGAVAIHQALHERGYAAVPSVRTIGYVLERRGALDGRKRPRRPAPPRGWYLPDVAAADAELDSFDLVEGLVIRDGPQVEVLNATSLHGGLIGSWPQAGIGAKAVVEALIEHWRAFGLPRYAQFDNDTRFQGPHQHPDVLGRVTRLCLGLGVTPVFVPPRETGFQAAIENLNGRWQAKVWARFRHDSLAALQARSKRFVAASRRRAAERIEGAPRRRRFPGRWHLDLQAVPQGRIVYLRRTSEHGNVDFLGHTFPVDPQWPHRLVRAVVDIDARRVRFYALRRRAPHHQPLLHSVAHSLPHRPFRE
jgi:transposase-like protein